MKREVVAKTYTPIYDEIEDRIRVSVNYDDISDRVDFMITRRFYIDMISSIDDFMMSKFTPPPPNPTPSQKPSSPIGQAPASNSGASEKNIYATNMENVQLYKATDELLLQINLQLRGEAIEMRFSSANSDAVSVMSIDMFRNLFNVIKNSAPKMAWGIGF